MITLTVPTSRESTMIFREATGYLLVLVGLFMIVKSWNDANISCYIAGLVVTGLGIYIVLECDNIE